MTRLVPLTVCYSIPQAVALRSMLAAYGIHTATNALRFAQLDWYRLVALGGIDVYVFEVDLQYARLLMSPVKGYVANLETEEASFVRRPIFNVAIFAAFYISFGWIIPLWLRDRRFLKCEEV